MAVRAVAVINSVDNFDYTDGTYAVTVDYAIIGTNYGDLGTGQGLQWVVDGISPDALAATVVAQVQSSLKAYLLAQNVPFGLLNIDTVRVLSSII